jgi:hypothetical protein
VKTSFSSIFVIIICLGIGFFFLTGSWGIYLDYDRQQSYSGQASGQVINKYFQQAADGSSNYYLDYLFVPVGGSKINCSSSISRQQWDALKINDFLEIRYDPSNPQRNIPDAGASLIFTFFMLVLGVVFMLFGGSRFLTSIKKPKSRT